MATATTAPISEAPPDGVFETLAAGDGTVLRCARWRGGARGGVVLLSGLTEFIEKYFEVIHRLRERDFAVYTMDWRGQGLSARMLPDRHKNHAVSFDDYLADLALFLDRVVLPDAPRPLHLLAHSMGGHLGLRHLHDRPSDFERAVCSAPMIDLPVPRGARTVGRLAVQFGASLGLKNSYMPGRGAYDARTQVFEGNLLTTDRARFERMHRYIAENPDLALGGPTLGWVDAAIRSIATENRPEFAAEIEIPVLVLYAAEEQVVSNDAMRRFAGWLPNATLETFKGARHELLMERDETQQQVWRAIDQHLGLA